MPTPILLTTTLLEATTGTYSFPLQDDSGQAVLPGFIETMTLTLIDLDSDQVLNGRDHQDVLNTNNGTLTSTIGISPVTTMSLALQPADTVILNPTRRVEYRVLTFRWTWNSGTKTATHCVQFGVENVPHVP